MGLAQASNVLLVSRHDSRAGGTELITGNHELRLHFKFPAMRLCQCVCVRHGSSLLASGSTVPEKFNCQAHRHTCPCSRNVSDARHRQCDNDARVSIIHTT